MGMLRAVVVGAGKRAAGLLTQMLAEPGLGLRPVAVVEPVEERRRQAVERFGLELAYASVEELLADRPQLDCAFVATPPWLHAPAFAACARAGLAVFCEKPADMELEAAEEIWRVARETGVPTMFGFNRRFTAAARVAKALLARSRPWFIHTSKSRPMTYSRMLAENAVHAVDLLLWLAGSVPRRVQAVGCMKDPVIEAERYVAASVEFVSGCAGSVHMVTEGRGAVERLEVYAQDFTFRAELPERCRFAGDPDRLARAAAEAGLGLESLGDGAWRVSQPGGDLRAELAAFAALVRGERRDVPGAAEAFEAQRLVEQIYAAAGLPPTRRSERWVRES
jgi:predicted dehydrogenase